MVIMGHNASLVSGDEEECEQGGGGRAREEGVRNGGNYRIVLP